MPSSYVSIERDGAVATVTFDRHKNLNAFDGQLIAELTEVARSFHDDIDTRAVVLTGSKDYFSAGADIEDLAARNNADLSDLERRQSYFRGVRLCEAWETMPQITVAAMERLAAARAQALARAAAEMPAIATQMIKEAVNATAGALNRTASFADADQSQLTAASQDARTARDRFNAR